MIVFPCGGTLYSSALLARPVEPLGVTCPHCNAAPTKACTTPGEQAMAICHTGRHERAGRAHTEPFILDDAEIAAHYGELERAVDQELAKSLPLVPGTSQKGRRP